MDKMKTPVHSMFPAFVYPVLGFCFCFSRPHSVVLMSPDGEKMNPLSRCNVSFCPTSSVHIKHYDFGVKIMSKLFTKKTQKLSAAHICQYAAEMQKERVASNVTSIEAPYRVRGIEMLIEVTFGETVECTLQYSTFDFCNTLSFILNFTQSQFVSVNRCCLFKINVH